ncbi:hypothetical protein DXN04_00855 [Chitinophaga silvisoli]|uniref:Uncharacterized protein n=1 Tax=Chitinophaga silvisoli TaxID=2291814 RepID=A0A3E1P7D1_9BACT|nr:hypothetical protein DXN04_00855 [Chitinophaga silvisoli]
MYNATKGIFQLIAFLVRAGEAFLIMNGLSHRCGRVFAGEWGGFRSSGAKKMNGRFLLTERNEQMPENE